MMNIVYVCTVNKNRCTIDAFVKDACYHISHSIGYVQLTVPQHMTEVKCVAYSLLFTFTLVNMSFPDKKQCHSAIFHKIQG